MQETEPRPPAGRGDDALRAVVPARVLGSRADFQTAVRETLLNAASCGVREMWWLGNDWSWWPLGEAAVVDALTAWGLRPGVRLHWYSHDFEPLRRLAPRLLVWRQTFAHVIDCRCPDELPSAAMPTLLLADRRLVLRVLDTEHLRGWVSHAPIDLQGAREEIDAISQRCSPSFAAVTLGL